MIKYPSTWRNIGVRPTLIEIEDTIQDTLLKLNCTNLALSGGIDSSYMLWCMVKVFGGDINCFTIASSAQHPDFIYSKLIANAFDDIHWNGKIPPQPLIAKSGDYPGDNIVRTFYDWLKELGIKQIIACDGIDEFMGGYYDHLHNPVHEIYYDFMVRLKSEQLEPLNSNSGSVEVLLPYMNEQLIALFNRIPMSERFDINGRKKIICELSKGKIPDEIIYRRKYGFVDAMTIKENSI